MSVPSSKNPFRRASDSYPSLASSDTHHPPPLPPRARVIQENHTSSSSSSSSSQNVSKPRFSPTSTTTPSRLIQRSLSEARHISESSPTHDASVHIIRKSHGPTPSRQRAVSGSVQPAASGSHSDVIAQVAQALKEAEMSPPPPPKRRPTVRASGRLSNLAKDYVAADPGINLWSCVNVLQGTRQSTPYAMIILNQPITMKETFRHAWAASDFHICADGGANRLYDLWNEDQRTAYVRAT
jgi:hypothetical protein